MEQLSTALLSTACVWFSSLIHTFLQLMTEEKFPCCFKNTKVSKSPQEGSFLEPIPQVGPGKTSGFTKMWNRTGEGKRRARPNLETSCALTSCWMRSAPSTGCPGGRETMQGDKRKEQLTEQSLSSLGWVLGLPQTAEHPLIDKLEKALTNDLCRDWLKYGYKYSVEQEETKLWGERNNKSSWWAFALSFLCSFLPPGAVKPQNFQLHPWQKCT